jgi:hypothetical protein
MIDHTHYTYLLVGKSMVLVVLLVQLCLLVVDQACLVVCLEQLCLLGL